MGKWRQRNHKIHSQLWMEYVDLSWGHHLEFQSPCVWVTNQLLLPLLEGTVVLLRNGCYGTWFRKDGLIWGWCIAILFLSMLNTTYPAQAISSSHMMDGFLGFRGCIILGRKSAKSLEISFRGFRRKLTYHVYQVISWKHWEKLCLLRYAVFLIYYYYYYF